MTTESKQWDGSVAGLVQVSHDTAVEKGWYEAPRQVPELLCLIHSEVSEALEEFRNGHAPTEAYISESKPGKPEGIPVELADVLIRIADMCGYYGIDLAEAIRVKLEYNSQRSYRHGGKKA